MTVYIYTKVEVLCLPVDSVDNVNGRENTAINILRSFKNSSVVHLYLFVTEYYIYL